MTLRIVIPALGLALLAACTAPYRPPVFVLGGTQFHGIAHHLKGGKSVDVVLVHGMCSHTRQWADEAIDEVVRAIDANVTTQARAPVFKMQPGPIEVVDRTANVAGGTIRFSAILWSPLTAKAKLQLDFDQTGSPTDCATAAECKPRRARLNGIAKDELLNDCLSDALIYQASRDFIRNQMAQTLEAVLARDEGSNTGETPLILVTESLGSKITFDALEQLRKARPGTRAKSTGQRAIDRTRLLIMAANQLPLLGLMDPVQAPTERHVGGPELDPLLRFLRSRSSPLDRQDAEPMTVVALNDPNDLLSYRLQPSRYATPDVRMADILVSNRRTWFGWLEGPYGAHTGYLGNPDVAQLIACGSRPGTVGCK